MKDITQISIFYFFILIIKNKSEIGHKLYEIIIVL